MLVFWILGDWNAVFWAGWWISGGYALLLMGRRTGEMFSFWCSASKKQEVLSFLHQGFGCGRTGAWCPGVTGCCKRWHWQAPFGDFRVLSADRYCVPKSWLLSRKLRTSSFFPESHQKENISPVRLVLAEFTMAEFTSWKLIYILSA